MKSNDNRTSPGRIKVSVDDDGGIAIVADEAGLRYLAECCTRIIGKDDPSGHIHLEWQFNNLVEGSVPVDIVFSNDPSDFKVEK